VTSFGFFPPAPVLPGVGACILLKEVLKIFQYNITLSDNGNLNQIPVQKASTGQGGLNCRRANNYKRRAITPEAETISPSPIKRA